MEGERRVDLERVRGARAETAIKGVTVDIKVREEG